MIHACKSRPTHVFCRKGSANTGRQPHPADRASWRTDVWCGWLNTVLGRLPRCVARLPWNTSVSASARLTPARSAPIEARGDRPMLHRHPRWPPLPPVDHSATVVVPHLFLPDLLTPSSRVAPPGSRARRCVRVLAERMCGGHWSVSVSRNHSSRMYVPPKRVRAAAAQAPGT